MNDNKLLFTAASFLTVLAGIAILGTTSTPIDGTYVARRIATVLAAFGLSLLFIQILLGLLRAMSPRKRQKTWQTLAQSEVTIQYPLAELLADFAAGKEMWFILHFFPHPDRIGGSHGDFMLEGFTLKRTGNQLFELEARVTSVPWSGDIRNNDVVRIIYNDALNTGEVQTLRY